jgi:transposase InsO family protein
MLGKSRIPPFPRASTMKGNAPGQYLVTDTMGPFATETLQGERYALTYTDWYSRYSWTYLLKLKSEAFKYLKHLLEVVFPAAQVTLRHYHSDNAGELCGRETTEYLERTIHATHSTSEAYTPQRNAVAERKFKTLGEMAATMLHESGLPKTMWGYIRLYGSHIYSESCT